MMANHQPPLLTHFFFGANFLPAMHAPLLVVVRRRIVIPEQALCGVAYQVVLGLDYLNDHGFLHRDVKPPSKLVGVLSVVCFLHFELYCSQLVC